jgi:uncharacterized membrane protein
MEKPSKETLEKWHKDSNNWKLGAFYYNKNDERLFIEKRNPNYGITINFANTKSYLFLLICLLFFGFITYKITAKK